MANNVFADRPAAIVAKTSISFASAGLDITKVRIIYEVGDPLKSFIPGRAINAITGFTQDKGYYMVPAVDLDLSAIVAPPLDAANITPPAPTAGIVDDTANTFDWTNAVGYVTADHETSINGGTTWTAATKPLSVGDVSLAIGQVMVRVKAATGRNAGPTLSNATAFNTGNITPAAPTAGVVDDTADTFNWTNNPTYTALSDYEYTLNGGSTYSVVTAKPISVGNVAKAIGQVGVRVKAATGRNVSATLFNASAFNVAAGDTTPPTVVSATAIDANTVRVVFSEVVTDSITAGSMAFKKNGAANNPTARSGSGTNTVDYTVPTMAAGDTILRTYVPATGDIKDAAGNELAAFTDVAVTNSITATTILSLAPWKQYVEADTGVTQAGGLVSVVADQVMSGGNTTYDLIQSTGANQPAYVASALNSKPGIGIDVSKFMVQRSSLSDKPKPLVRAALVVFTTIHTGANYNYLGYFSGSGSRADFGLDNAGKPFMYSGSLLVGPTALVINTPYWFWCEYLADGTGNLYVNNVLQNSGSTGAQLTYNGGGIGDNADGAVGNVMILGYIGETALPSSTVRTDVYNAVKAKYGF